MIYDIIIALKDLHKQATVERSHYYTGESIEAAITEITQLRADLATAQAERDELAARVVGLEAERATPPKSSADIQGQVWICKTQEEADAVMVLLRADNPHLVNALEAKRTDTGGG